MWDTTIATAREPRIKTADWIIDLGPKGGAGGGELVAVGRPESIAASKDSYTGQALKRALPQRGDRRQFA